MKSHTDTQPSHECSLKPRVQAPRGVLSLTLSKQMFWMNDRPVFIVIVKTHNVKLTVLTIFSAQFTSAECIYIVVKQSSRSFSSWPLETMYSLNDSHSPQRPRSQKPPS